jgi:hypothetical protein
MIRLTACAAIAVAAMVIAGCNNPGALQGNYGTIFGKVTSTSGQPIANATVVIDGVINTPTLADGTYSYSNVPLTDPLSPATVSAQASGYQTSSVRSAQCQTAGCKTEVDFTLSPG